MVEMTVGHYRCSDDADELTENRAVTAVVKPRPRFTVHSVRAVVEQMDEDSDEDVEKHKSKTDGSEHVKRVSRAMSSDKRKRKLDVGDTDSSDEDEDDVEPGGNPSDFIEELMSKLQTVATSQKISDEGRSMRKNRLSLKKTGTKTSGWNRTNEHGTDDVGNKTSDLAVPQATDLPEDWYRIEAISDNEPGMQSKPLRMGTTVDKLSSPRTESNVLRSVEDRKKQMPVSQPVKPSPRQRKALKYSEENDSSDASQENIEEYDSDEEGDEFHSLTSGSLAGESEKGPSPHKSLSSSFWLASPE